MLDGDLADSPLASHWPDIEGEADTLRDFLRESFAQFKGDLPTTRTAFTAVCFELINIAFKETPQSVLDRAEAAMPREENILIELLELLSRDTDRHYRMRALCYLRLLGREGRSFEELGQLLGTKKQTVDKCYRDIQRRLNIPGLGDKSPEAKEKYRQLRIGKRKLRAPWHGLNAWKLSQPINASKSVVPIIPA